VKIPANSSYLWQRSLLFAVLATLALSSKPHPLRADEVGARKALDAFARRFQARAVGDDPLRKELLERLRRRGAQLLPDWEERHDIAGRSVVVWRRQPDPAAPRPVVFFSHGLYGAATQSRFLALGLANSGYVVIAPEHRDSIHFVGGRLFYHPGGAPFPRVWSDATFRDRAEDLTAVIAALRADPAWSRRLDWSRMALTGHSLGGYTVLGLAGAWPSWKLAGVKAVLAMSPHVLPFLPLASLATLNVPVMYQSGSKDWAVRPSIDGPRGAFALTSAPAQLVEFEGANHFAWSDVPSVAHASILSVSRAFLDTYLKDGKVSTTMPADVSYVRRKD
jgi:dienelactone hydrolase